LTASPSSGGVSKLALVGQNIQCLPLVGTSLLVSAFPGGGAGRQPVQTGAIGVRRWAEPPQPDGGSAGGRVDGGGGVVRCSTADDQGLGSLPAAPGAWVTHPGWR